MVRLAIMLAALLAACGGDELLDTTRPEPSDLMRVDEVIAVRPDLAGAIQTAVEEADRDDACIREQRARAARGFDLDWNLVFHLRGDGKSMSITDVYSAAWPGEIDAEARACLVGAFQDVTWKWPQVEEFSVEFPLCTHRDVPGGVL